MTYFNHKQKPQGARAAIEAFRAAYIETLTAAVTKDPALYAYPVEAVPATVDKMIRALAKGEGNIGPAVRAAARKLGIKPTITEIKSYLSPIATAPLSTPVTPGSGSLPDGPDGTHYKITTITDANGVRWWVNAWTEGTPYHAMGASSARPAPVEPAELEMARTEARASLTEGGAL